MSETPSWYSCGTTVENKFIVFLGAFDVSYILPTMLLDMRVVNYTSIITDTGGGHREAATLSLRRTPPRHQAESRCLREQLVAAGREDLRHRG